MELLFEKRLEVMGHRLLTLKACPRRLVRMLKAAELAQAQGDGLRIKLFFHDAAGIGQEYEVLLTIFHGSSTKRSDYHLSGHGWRRLVADQRLQAGDFIMFWAARQASDSGGDRDGEQAGGLVLVMRAVRKASRMVEHRRQRQVASMVVDQLATDLARRLRPTEETAVEEQLAADFSQLSIPVDADGVLRNN